MELRWNCRWNEGCRSADAEVIMDDLVGPSVIKKVLKSGRRK